MTAFDERLREAVAEAQRVQRASFGETALLSLAVVPLWTSDIPGPHGLHELDERVEDWVARCEAAGLCESREIIGRDGLPAVAFEMTASVRADVLAAADPLEAARVARMIGDVVYPAPAFVPRSLRRWAELAFLDPNIMGDELSKRANAAIDARDAGTALDWITVGEILTPVFGGDVGSAVARARRRLNLLYRAQQDERLLAGFVRREDQIGAVERLLSGPGDEWALHLIGLGGAGKTMLIRYIGTLLAGERRLERLVVARVDFDYIDARFPFEQPAELLVRLCDGLAMYVEDSTQEALLEAFVRAKRDADDTLGGPGGDPRQRIMDAPMQRVLDAWAEFVASLGDRVLLILDTCEELAKLHAGEEAVPSVEAMWRLMTETHRRLPHLRVLLAGRRLLAAADAEGPYDLLPGLVASFEERPYLRTFEIRGFDRVEAVQLLGGADPALADAILANARELGRSPGVRGGGAGPAPDRYNPFDLNLYAAWLRANPELTAEDVSRADTDAYVEARIIARLHDDGVDAALPAIATLGR
ncbi:MAG TPA: hypothetical protein VFG79_07715, partial [Solirubrobacter sp.]|nr:hypothetical protein [Solirubrobacter sp.]